MATKQKRFVVYASVELLRALRSKLSLRGLSISEWFRRKAQEEIEREDVGHEGAGE